jgi:hypothetical protein
MSDQEYLEAILADQTLEEGGEELKALRAHRKDVEDLLRAKVGLGGPSIRYGGSYKKGTMNRDSYDLDMTCYFGREDTVAGTTLKEIYENVEEALREKYWTERKGSAIRLRSLDDLRSDFHIDVVPGRFVEGKEGDVHLYRSNGDKAYLKTNLDVHIDHVQGSGAVPAIRLMKLWSVRRYVEVKTFALELLAIKLLEGKSKQALADQLEHVLTELRDHSDSLAIVDPANANNDLGELLNEAVRFNLQSAAEATLRSVEENGWEAIFGPAEKKEKAAALSRLAVAAVVRPKPYHPGDDVV